MFSFLRVFVVQHNFLRILMNLLVVHIMPADLLFTGLDDVLSRLEQVEQRPSVLFFGWGIALTRVVMKVMLVSHGGGYVRKRRTE